LALDFRRPAAGEDAGGRQPRLLGRRRLGGERRQISLQLLRVFAAVGDDAGQVVLLPVLNVASITIDLRGGGAGRREADAVTLGALVFRRGAEGVVAERAARVAVAAAHAPGHAAQLVYGME